MKREHLFITIKHFENCHKFQIFGVGKTSINQFGLVNKGDKIFFLDRNDNLIIGPYTIASDIFYNEEIIWQEEKGIDAYPYRVSLKSDVLYKINCNTFSRIIEKNNIRIDSSDLRQKSVFTFLPKDRGIIEPFLIKRGESIKRQIVPKIFTKKDITIELAKSHGFTEAFLEYFILKDFNRFFSNSNFIIYNQLRINLLGSKIDIIASSPKEILIMELKKGIITRRDIEQLQEYTLWIKDSRALLSKLFGVTLDDALIKNIIIGADVQKGIKTNHSLLIKKYFANSHKLNLLDYTDE